MSVFYIVVVVIHVAVAVAMIAIVLLQTGKGSGLSGVFGAGGAASESFFGGRGPSSFLAKLTTAAAITFMVTALALAKLSSMPKGGRSVMTGGRKTEEKQPVKTPMRPPAKTPPTKK
jgi:protein translocase SecG subunit